MKDLKTKKFWFLVFTVSICISFSGFTLLSQFVESTKVYAENVSSPTAETCEKSSEPNNSFYIPECACEIPIVANGSRAKNLGELKFILPFYSPSPNTPPPDLG